MAAALAVVWLCEWLAARARTRVPASAYESVAFTGYAEVVESHREPAPYVEAPALDPGVGWSAFEPAAAEPPEDTEEDVELPPDEEPPAVEAEGGADPAAAPPELEQTMDEPPPRRGWLRRRRAKAEPEPPAEPAVVPEPPTHVRVLTPSHDVRGSDAPWERGFDGEND